MVTMRPAFISVLVAAAIGCGDDATGDEAVQGALSSGEIQEVQQLILAAVAAAQEPQATLHVYLCPDFNVGCLSTEFMLEGVCTPIDDATTGSCYDTGILVRPGVTYALEACHGCSDCSAPLSFETPAFFDEDFYPGGSWHCATMCAPPPNCP